VYPIVQIELQEAKNMAQYFAACLFEDGEDAPLNFRSSSPPRQSQVWPWASHRHREHQPEDRQPPLCYPRRYQCGLFKQALRYPKTKGERCARLPVCLRRPA
jgi:hypothetical protein